MLSKPAQVESSPRLRRSRRIAAKKDAERRARRHRYKNWGDVLTSSDEDEAAVIRDASRSRDKVVNRGAPPTVSVLKLPSLETVDVDMSNLVIGVNEAEEKKQGDLSPKMPSPGVGLYHHSG